LEVSITTTYRGSNRNQEEKSRENWQLSTDNKALTIVQIVPDKTGGEKITELIYKKGE
jgi:hypothetical protein